MVVWEIAERAEPVRMISREAHGLFRTDRTYVILSTQFTPERRKQHRLYFGSEQMPTAICFSSGSSSWLGS